MATAAQARARAAADALSRAPRVFMSNVFIAGFAVAALMLFAAGLRVFARQDLASGSDNWTIAILIANFVVVVLLAAHIGRRLWRLAASRRGRDAPAPRLHLRFVSFLGVAAAVPAILIALFLGVIFTQMLDDWFSDRVGSVVENVAEVARAYLREEGDAAAEQLSLMAGDLSQPAAVSALTANRITYANYLKEQAVLRGFEAAYVVDSAGSLLARADLHGAAEFLPPDTADLAAAAQGEAPWAIDRAAGRIRVLYRLDAYPDAFLYVTRDVGGDIMPFLNQAEQRLTEYRDAAAGRQGIKAVFALVYLEATALVLLGAVWFGLTAANRFVAPIGRLARAAERVRDGDLTTRVVLDDRRDEIAVLGRAFNEMTDQLRSQREELVAATEVAEERREFSEAVLAGVSAGVVGVNAQGRVTLANGSALDLLGADAASNIIGAEIALGAPEFASLVAEARAAAGVIVERLIDIERPGRARHLNARAAAARDGSGAVVVTFDDITRLVSAQRNAAWRDVARRIAHEIKNPLTPIQLSAERLRRKYQNEITSDPDVFERCTDTIVRQVADIGRMVDEFSSFARMPEPRLERADLGEVVRAAVFAQRVASPAIAFDVDTPSDPVHAVCDERLIAQALANILKNAAEAVAARQEIEPGAKDAPGRVHAQLRNVGGKAVVEVSDDGVGWPVALRERLTEPYMTTREKGTGLGLAIVRRIAEDHAGRLELDDRADGASGAVVRLVLPADESVGAPRTRAAEGA